MHDDTPQSRVNFLEHVVSNDEQLFGILGAMIAEAKAGNPAGDMLSQSLSVALLAHLYDRYDRSRAAERLEGRLVGSQVATIRRYVKENIGKDLSIVELSSLFHLSPSHFCRAFSKTLGVTPHRFVLNERISIAKSQLRKSSPLPQAELANELGFASTSYFSEVFRKLVGCSPSAFRRRGR